MARGYPGDRPSATILCDELGAATLGSLVAFHEHRTFVSAMMLGINPFDQFGVELGKEMAKSVDDPAARAGFDVSTRALIDKAGV
jgi:glucose-6-phosphate isomerase